MYRSLRRRSGSEGDDATRVVATMSEGGNFLLRPCARTLQAHYSRSLTLHAMLTLAMVLEQSSSSLEFDTVASACEVSVSLLLVSRFAFTEEQLATTQSNIFASQNAHNIKIGRDICQKQYSSWMLMCSTKSGVDKAIGTMRDMAIMLKRKRKKCLTCCCWSSIDATPRSQCKTRIDSLKNIVHLVSLRVKSVCVVSESKTRLLREFLSLSSMVMCLN